MIQPITFAVVLLWSVAASGHHWVGDVYDDKQRFIVEVDVHEFELINPHPLMFVEIVGIPEQQEIGDVAIGQTWTLEMDNKRELTALGINDETFVPGDRILVAVDPSRHTRYRQNTLYLRAVEHQREGFVYLHNVRQLYRLDAGENLLSLLREIR